ncbi:related to Inhibitor-sensitive equilibrative nucleoside transporter 1 [Ustilago trichophora]|uniref:Related to Inhibitor-sensitive equilibrative nucleoside transporter 1 n=1 Tax=Ustilago trichophora TaxID=86804 RepID=A0A5C3DSL7_9BASI|nr:related to Inhibitor-sensitive equilibrative nucleoside transporter 1 [Ustilago trichophora]
MRPLRGEEQGLLARSHDGLSTPLLTPTHEDGPAEPLIKTGVEGAPAWQQMSARQRTFVYVTFGLLGMGVLLPFNSLITPAEYFRSSFARTPYANTFSSWITVSYNVISILVGIHATATGGFERSSPRRRITLSSSVIILSVFCFALSTRVGDKTSRSGHHDDQSTLTPSNTYFYFTLFVGGLLSSACAYLQNSVVSLSTAFGAGGSFMGSMLAGQGVVGVGISIFGIASAWSQQTIPAPGASGVDEAAQDTARGIARAATLFFGMNTMLMMMVLGAFLWLVNTPLYAQVMAKQVATIDKIEDERDDPSRRDDDDVEDRAEHGMTQSWHSIRSISHPAYSSWLKKVPGFYRLSPATRESLLRISLVQSKVKWDCAAVAFVFVVTLSIFPALTSSVQSVYTGSSKSESSSVDLTSPQLFVPFHFFLFNLSDLLGRTLPSLVPAALIRKARALFSLSLLRSLFVPLFMACNVVSTSQRTGPISRINADAPDGWLAGLMQSSDAPFFGLMLLLGFSNGLVSTCIMISGPSRSKLVNSKGASEGPLAATLLSFWLCVGLAIGSGLSFLTVKA